MNFDIKSEHQFQFIEVGEGEVLLLLHGLFGALSNFSDLVTHFSATHKVVVPILPIYTLPLRQSTVPALAKYVADFINYKGFERVILLGNSLGGHIALKYCLMHLEKVVALVLTGSSGLFENALGGSFPKRKNYEFIKEKTAYTFYDPKTATKELVDEVFEIVNNRNKAIRVVAMAKSAIRNNMGDDLHKIDVPTCLIWGKHDRITPPFVAEDFQKLLPNAELTFLDKSGHAPMMEEPEAFNHILEQFLAKLLIKL